MIETLKRWGNWIRINWLRTFTDRVKTYKVKDADNREHEVTVEKKLEKVCDHKTITEIAPTMWKCTGCPTYFQVNYKVMLTEHDLVGFLESIAEHLKVPVGEDHA